MTASTLASPNGSAVASTTRSVWSVGAMSVLTYCAWWTSALTTGSMKAVPAPISTTVLRAGTSRSHPRSVASQHQPLRLDPELPVPVGLQGQRQRRRLTAHCVLLVSNGSWAELCSGRPGTVRGNRDGSGPGPASGSTGGTWARGATG